MLLSGGSCLTSCVLERRGMEGRGRTRIKEG